MSDRINSIQKIATEIVCAELINGNRLDWIYNFTEEKKEKIVAAAVQMAKMIVDKTDSTNENPFPYEKIS